MNKPLMIPGPRAMARHAYPNILEGKVVPLVLFVGFLELAGVVGALITALAWSLSSIVYRVATGRKVPGLVILSTVGLTAKTIAALATGSLVVYFLQPTISTFLVGLAFLISVPLGKPLAERLAHDFCPFDAETADHPQLRNFFLRLSLLWAVTSLVNGAITAWMLFTQSVTTFVVIKSFMGPVMTAITIAVAVFLFRRRMARAGVSVVFGSSMAVGPA